MTWLRIVSAAVSRMSMGSFCGPYVAILQPCYRQHDQCKDSPNADNYCIACALGQDLDSGMVLSHFDDLLSENRHVLSFLLALPLGGFGR